jgi:phosphoribosylformylglycinamidine synthase
VVQVRTADRTAVEAVFARHGLTGCVACIGSVSETLQVRVRVGADLVLHEPWVALRSAWSETSYHMRRLRDDPECAEEERQSLLDTSDPGLSWQLSFDPAQDIAAPYINRGSRPRVAVLREQGVNSQVEMAAALDRAGFEAHDVHMTDIIDRGRGLEEFKGLIACGGFSYGDVLGAGGGWARSILFHEHARRQFAQFFARGDSFALGVCNGCQMFALLKPLIPGAEHWPRFLRNRSEQFEARFSMVEITESPSILLAGMHGSRLPIAIAHGEGSPDFASAADLDACVEQRLVAFRYIGNDGRAAVRYPANPNGAVQAIAALTTDDGRVTITMPHPERVYRTVQNSWHPAAGVDSGWMRIFRNARVWVG